MSSESGKGKGASPSMGEQSGFLGKMGQPHGWVEKSFKRRNCDGSEQRRPMESGGKA